MIERRGFENQLEPSWDQEQLLRRFVGGRRFMLKKGGFSTLSRPQQQHRWKGFDRRAHHWAQRPWNPTLEILRKTH